MYQEKNEVNLQNLGVPLYSNFLCVRSKFLCNFQISTGLQEFPLNSYILLNILWHFSQTIRKYLNSKHYSWS